MNILTIIIIQIYLHIHFIYSSFPSSEYLSIPVKFIDFSTAILMYTSSNKLYFNLDLTNNISLITNAYYFEHPSPLSYTLHSETITTYNNHSIHYKCNFMKDKFFFRENYLSLDIYPYLFFYTPLSHVPPHHLQTSLSLCHYYHNTNHSLIYQYYKKGLIQHKVFGIWFNMNKQYDINTYLYIGGVPKILTSSNNYIKHSINVAHYEQKWKFKVKDVGISVSNGNSNSNNNIVYYNSINDVFGFISLSNDDIQVDDAFFEWINVNVFEKYYYTNNTCKLNDKPKQIKAIECKVSYIQYFPTMYIQIQHNIFELNKHNLFNYYTDTCLFIIKPYKDTTYNYFNNEWIFGYKWLLQLHDTFIEFNYDTDIISIYINKANILQPALTKYITHTYYKLITTLYTFITLIQLINVFIIIIYKYI